MHRFLVVGLLLLAACGEPTPPAATVASIVVTPTADSVGPGETRQFDASVRDGAGHPVPAARVIWRSSSPDVASIGLTGLASGVSIGAVTISAAVGTVTGEATLRVIPLAASITVVSPRPTVRGGRRLQLTSAVRDGAGQEIAGRKVDWSTSDGAVASVDSTGLVSGLSTGVTTITVAVGRLSDRISITVLPRLVVQGADSLLVPGGPFHIRGGGLDSASVVIRGTQLAPTSESDTLLVLAVPDGLFGPCTSDTATTTIEIGLPLAAAVSLRRSIAERPIVAALNRGQHFDASASISAGCRVLVDSPGEYLALVYAAEAPDSIDLQFETIAPGAPAPSPETSGGPALPILSSPASPSDVVLTRAAPAAACSVPSRIGDSITMSTRRNAQGKLDGVAGSGWPIESWELVGLARQVAFFIDSTTKRLASADPRIGQLIARTVAFADTAAVGFIDQVTRGLPDKDQNGRVIVYLAADAAIGASGWAFPWTSYRADCGEILPSGEAILLAMNISSSPVPPFTQADLQQVVLVHELAHIADLGWLPPYLGGFAFLYEGYATFISSIFPERTHGDPFAFNRSDPPAYPDGSSAQCVVWPIQTLSDPSFAAWYYGPGCNFTGYLFSLRRAASRETVKQMSVRWSTMESSNTIGTMVEQFLRPGQPGALTFAEWLLSWYADDFVPGTSQALQQPYWNPRAFWAKWLAGLGPYPLPHAVIGSQSIRSELQLGRVDARFMELTAVRGTAVTLRGKTPLPGGGRVGMLLLRR